MQYGQCALAALIGTAGIWLAASSSAPAYRAVVGRDLGPETAALEARASARPDDAAALVALVDHYLEHGAPGLAQAAIDRAPRGVRALPTVANVRVRTLWHLGFVPDALDLQRDVLSACQVKPCSRSLVGRAQRRERLLSELARLGIEDPELEPSLTLVAYQRSTREVRLETQ